MKISCLQGNLLKSVNMVQKAVPSKTMMPILECILIKAESGWVSLTASDMELGITSVVGDTQVEEEGQVAVNAKLFSDIVKSLPKGTVFIETDDLAHMKIRCEKAEYDIIGRTGEEFPEVKTDHETEPIVLSEATLAMMIKEVAFSAGIKDGTSVMKGVYTEIHNDRMKMVALDGHRIAIRTVNLKGCFPDTKAIIPAKSLMEVAKNLNAEEEMDIYFAQSQAIFETDDATMVTRLIAGEYFNYEQLISKDCNTKISVRRKDFLNSVIRATVITDGVERKPVILDVKDDVMEICGNSAIARGREDVDIAKDGADLTIGMNPKYLTDALRVISDDEVEVHFIDRKSPCIIGGESYIYVILPVNFSRERS